MARFKCFFKNAIFPSLSVLVSFRACCMGTPCAEQHMGTTPFFQIWLIYDKTAWKPTRYKLGFIRESPRFSFARLYSGPASTSGIHPRRSSLPAMNRPVYRAPHVLTASGQMRGCRRADTLGTAQTQKSASAALPWGSRHSRHDENRSHTAD